jgi:hypothetical protein
MSSTTAKRLLGITGALAASVMLSAVPVLTAMPAYAQPNDWHGHNDHRPPPPPPRGGDWHGGGYHGGGGYHNNTGAIVGGALLGLGVGAAIGAMAAPPVVYRPAPTYYAPPPVYYGY